MNWRKLIANTVYVIYMAVNVVVLLAATKYFAPDTTTVWNVTLFVSAAFFYILTTMHITYWLMPVGIRVYWHDDPPK